MLHRYKHTGERLKRDCNQMKKKLEITIIVVRKIKIRLKTIQKKVTKVLLGIPYKLNIRAEPPFFIGTENIGVDSFLKKDQGTHAQAVSFFPC